MVPAEKPHTFAPLGPFIVPKEFVEDPQSLEQTSTLNGTLMLDSNTGNMTHDIYAMLSYISNILALRPGDVYAMGSPSGVGTAREHQIYNLYGKRRYGRMLNREHRDAHESRRRTVNGGRERI